ncbi:hypothetical protein [Schlesneria paludicola]|uniref:hypothetical protein n=1 Tax=Schlesneria paludicola TaxID=360056 RepID=UPI000299F9D9
MPLPPPSSAPDGKPGRSIDAGKGRIFPCDRCGADLVFSIGQQSLQCPYCGQIQRIEHQNRVPIVERDYLKMLAKLQRQRESKSLEEDDQATTQHAVRCDSCGAEVVFQGTLTSSSCPYCACPLQRDKVHDSVSRIPVDGMLPFLVPAETAAENLRAWVKSLWWAPNEFLKQGASGKFNGVYLPFFTFDTLAYTTYTGRRGDAYFITVGEGNNRRTERRVNWSSAGGEFEQFFDDVLIIAANGQHADLVRSLEPWPLDSLISFTPEVLAGFFSRTYDIPLEDSFSYARQLIEAALAQSARQRIGGDEQQITSLNANYSRITYKHLLLPVWLLAYRYRNETYQVMINATTGVVSGQRPYSAVKIAFAITLAVIVALFFWGLSGSSDGIHFSANDLQFGQEIHFGR